MGSDKESLFHQRKAKTESDAKRKQAYRQPYLKVLIVCEGEKTEPLYFQEMIDYYEVHTANVTVSGNCGSAPISVVDHGLTLFNAEKRKSPNNPFDRVYLVFDRDAHETYHDALNKINAQKPKDVFLAINSVPSFEYWLLLHFTLTTRPFFAKGRNNSSGREAFDVLKKCMPSYEKKSRGTFRALLEKLPDAIRNADSANAAAISNNTDNPSTQVHKLVELLKDLKSKRV